jgi:hypothetical protein
MVENMKFANDPRVEPAFRKRVDKNLLVTNLDVTNAGSEAADCRTRFDRAQVVVM